LLKKSVGTNLNYLSAVSVNTIFYLFDKTDMHTTVPE